MFQRDNFKVTQLSPSEAVFLAAQHLRTEGGIPAIHFITHYELFEILCIYMF